MPIIALVLLALPESMLLGGVALSIMGIHPKFKPLLAVALLQALTAYLVRMLSLPMALHAVVLMLFLGGYLANRFRAPLKRTISGAFIAWVLLAISEALLLPLFFQLFSVTVPEVLASPWLRILASLPQQIVLLAVFVIAYRIRGFHLQHRQAGNAKTAPVHASHFS